MRAQCLPSRVHVAGPKERSVALHARVAIAVQRIRPFVGAIELRTLPVHSVPHQARSNVQRIALVRPPAIHTERKNVSVLGPIATRLLLNRLLRIAWIMYGAVHFPRLDHHVKSNLEMLLMQLLEDRLWIRKNFLVELKFSVVGIPAGGTESGAQIDHGIARQLFFTKPAGFLQELLGAGERAMRLLIAKTPQGWQFGITRQSGVFRHDSPRVSRDNNKNVERKRRSGRDGMKAAFSAGEIERAERLMEKHRPAGSPDQPRNRNTAAMHSQLIAAL